MVSTFGSRKAFDFSKVSALIVDDSAYMRRIMKLLLTSLGFGQVFECEDGADALRLIKAQPVDIILIDWEMPVLSGLEFVQMLRNSSDTPNPFVPIVMVTGHSEAYRVMEARDVGVNEFLVKPISANSVYGRLVAVIQNPRQFVRSKRYFGPDRRRRENPNYSGSERRKDRQAGGGAGTLDDFGAKGAVRA